MKRIITIAALFFASMFMFNAEVNAGDVKVCHYHRNYYTGATGDIYIYYDKANTTFHVEWKETYYSNSTNEERLNLTASNTNSDGKGPAYISSAALKALEDEAQCPNRAFLDQEGTDNEICIDDYDYNVAHHDHKTSQTTKSFCGKVEDWNAGTEFDVDTRYYLKTGTDYFDKKVDEAKSAVKKISVDDITYEQCINGTMGDFINKQVSDSVDKLIAGWPEKITDRINPKLESAIETKREEAETICTTLINEKAAAGEITEEEAQEYIEEVQLITTEDILSGLSLSTSKYFQFDLKAKPICGIFGEKTWGYVQMAYSMIKLFIPAIIVLLGMVDFLKVLFSGEEKDMKTSGIKFMKRIAAGIIFILLPVLIEFLIHVVGFSENCLQQLFKISL